MAFKYSCFISYRHGKGRLLKRIAFELEEALSSELEAVTELPLYIDKTIESGDLYNPILATALCESVCMVIISCRSISVAPIVIVRESIRQWKLWKRNVSVC